MKLSGHDIIKHTITSDKLHPSVKIGRKTVNSTDVSGMLDQPNWLEKNIRSIAYIRNKPTFNKSIIDEDNVISLVGDVDSPGGGKFYGTGIYGERGWYDFLGLGDETYGRLDSINIWEEDQIFKKSIGSHDYNPELSGWKLVNPEGKSLLDIRGIIADEIYAKAFIADLDLALLSGHIVTKSVTQLSRNFIVPITIATTDHPRWNEDTTHYGVDAFNFRVLPGGYRLDSYELYDYVGLTSRFFGSTEISHNQGITLEMIYNGGSVSSAGSSKRMGFSVRCVRDATIEEQALGDGTVIYSDYTGNDGQIYDAVKIGLQVWIRCNLSETKYMSGDIIPTGLNHSAWESQDGTEGNDGAMTVYPYSSISGLESEEEVITAYGRLYNWYAVVNTNELINTVGGWHIPTEGEFLQLRDYITDMSEWSLSTVGNALKSVRQVNTPYTIGDSTLYVEDLPGFPASQVFEDNDWIRLQVVDRSGGGLKWFKVWVTINPATYNIAGDEKEGEQSFEVTVEYAGINGSAAGQVVNAGAAAQDWGQSGDGFIEQQAAGALGSNRPYLRIGTWEIDPSIPANINSRIIFGNVTDSVGNDGVQIGYNKTNDRTQAFLGNAEHSIDWNYLNEGRITIRGGITQRPSGESVDQVVFRGSFVLGTIYYKGDEVLHNDILWLYHNVAPSNDKVPGVDTDYWRKSDGEPGKNLINKGGWQEQIYNPGNYVFHLSGEGITGDWFLPTNGEISSRAANNLDASKVNTFYNKRYWTSTEYETDTTQALTAAPGWGGTSWEAKSSLYYVRPVRRFKSSSDYSYNDVGPQGGWIFEKVDLGGGLYEYYEITQEDLYNEESESYTFIWANINDEIGIFSVNFGMGESQTDAIIAFGVTSGAAYSTRKIDIYQESMWILKGDEDYNSQIPPRDDTGNWTEFKSIPGKHARLLKLTTTSHVFHFDTEGNPDPAGQQITFLAEDQHLGGNFSWSTDPDIGVLLTGSGNTRQLHIDDFESEGLNKIKIQVDKQDLSDTITVVRVTDGGDGFAVFLTNEAHNYPADPLGNISSFINGYCQVRIYQGANKLTCPDTSTSVPTVNNTYKVTDIFIDGTMGYDLAVVSNQFEFRPTSMGTDKVIVTLTVVARHKNVNTEFTKIITYSKSRKGDQGDPGDEGPQGPQGDQGDQGPQGDQGDQGPGLVYRGVYNSSVIYYKFFERVDSVYYNNTYWLVDVDTGIEGWSGTSLGTPGTNDNWTEFGAVLDSVATRLLLAEDATITRTLTMGTADPNNPMSGNNGIIQSANYDPDTSGFKLEAENGKFYAMLGKIAGVNFDSECLYTDIKHTDDGYSSTGITIVNDGSIHTRNFYINSNGDIGIRTKEFIFSYLGVSDNVVILDSSINTTPSDSWIKIKELQLGPYIRHSGVKLRIKWDYSSIMGNTVYTNVYKNGEQASPLAKFTDSLYWETVYWDISDWQSGDNVEIWGKTDGSAGEEVYVRDLRVCCDIVETVDEVTKA